MPTPTPATRPQHARPGALRHGSAAAGVIDHALSSTDVPHVMNPRPATVRPTHGTAATGTAGRGLRDYARRMAFLTELDSQTWLSRYSAAERLGDPQAVVSVPSYAAWLRRTGTAWAGTAMPSPQQVLAVWPFEAAAPAVLDLAALIEVDAREAGLGQGGPGPGHIGRAAPTSSRVDGETVDTPYAAAALYVAVSTAVEVAVLAADVEHLSATAARTTLPQRYLRHSVHLAGLRTAVRRELADWAGAAGTQARERVVLTARHLMDELASGLTSAAHHPGW